MNLNFAGAGPDAKLMSCGGYTGMSTEYCGQIERGWQHIESMQRAQLAEAQSRAALNFATANQMSKPVGGGGDSSIRPIQARAGRPW